MPILSSRNTSALMGIITACVAAARGIMLVVAIWLLIVYLLIPQLTMQVKEGPQGVIDRKRIQSICSQPERVTNRAASITCELLGISD
jgi:hypothetical protein